MPQPAGRFGAARARVHAGSEVPIRHPLQSLLLATACAGASPPAPAPPVDPPCDQLPVETDVAKTLAARWAEGGVVAVGEHHGVVAQIDLVVAVIDALPQGAGPLDFAWELWPGSVSVEGAEGSWPGWSTVLAARYWPEPLHVAEYERVYNALVRAHQRGVAVSVVGLSPDCSVAPTPTGASDALACFSSRDDTMLKLLQQRRRDHSGRGLLLYAGWRHVGDARWPDAPEPLGRRLPPHWGVYRVLLSGPEGSRGRTCGGLADRLASRRESPVGVSTQHVAQTVPDCLDVGGPSLPLSSVFDLLVGFSEHSAATAYTGWDRLPQSTTATAAWNRLETTLMDRSPTSDWRRWATDKVDEQVALEPPNPSSCSRTLPSAGDEHHGAKGGE